MKTDGEKIAEALANLPDVTMDLADKVAALATECRSLRERLKDAQTEAQRLRDERTTVCRCLGVTPLITPEELNHHATAAFCALLREPQLLAQREALLVEFCGWCRTTGIEFRAHDDSEQDVGRAKWFLALRSGEDKP